MRSFSILLLALLHLCSLNLSAQVELVPNGGFEEHMECPGQTSFGALMNVNCVGWITPTQGSPDYYSTCATNIAANTVGNVFGPQPPHSGEAYIGSYMFSYNQPELREYAQVELLQPIAPGIRYLVGFYVSRADSGLFSVNTIGAHFSTAPISSNDVWVLPVEADVVNAHTDSLIDSNIWYHITDTFVSRVGGGERYLTIGNFSVAAESDTHLVRPPLQISFSAAYYYIDDVSVIALDTLNGVAEAAPQRMAAWPNPATATVQLQWPVPLQQGAELQLYDAQGRSVLIMALPAGSTKAQLSVAQLPPGIYMAVVQQGNGVPMRERVVVVKH